MPADTRPGLYEIPLRVTVKDQSSSTTAEIVEEIYINAQPGSFQQGIADIGLYSVVALVGFFMAAIALRKK